MLNAGRVRRSCDPVGVPAEARRISGQGSIAFTFRAGSAEQFGINVRAGNGQVTQIGYDTTTDEVYVDRTRSGKIIDPTFGAVHRAPLRLHHGTVRLRVLVDNSSVEVFTDQGQVVLTDQIFPDETSRSVSLFANGGTANLLAGTGWNMRSIWR